MPRQPHDRDECNENCRGCDRCYMRTGDTVCDWTCAHAAQNHEDELAELADEEEEQLS